MFFAFQANIYAILIAKILCSKIIVRANSAPSGWSHNLVKKKLYSIIINLADDVMVNSNDFRREFNKSFKIKSKCIYNPFYKTKLNINFNKTFSKKLFKNFIDWKIN